MDNSVYRRPPPTRRGARVRMLPGRVTVTLESNPRSGLMSWIVWLIVAGVLGVAELLTTTLAFGLIAVAALVGSEWFARRATERVHGN